LNPELLDRPRVRRRHAPRSPPGLHPGPRARPGLRRLRPGLHEQASPPAVLLVGLQAEGGGRPAPGARRAPPLRALRRPVRALDAARGRPAPEVVRAVLRGQGEGAWREAVDVSQQADLFGEQPAVTAPEQQSPAYPPWFVP